MTELGACLLNNSVLTFFNITHSITCNNFRSGYALQKSHCGQFNSLRIGLRIQPPLRAPAACRVRMGERGKQPERREVAAVAGYQFKYSKTEVDLEEGSSLLGPLFLFF